MLRLLAILAIGYLAVSGGLPNPAPQAVGTEVFAAVAIALLSFPTLRKLFD